MCQQAAARVAVEMEQAEQENAERMSMERLREWQEALQARRETQGTGKAKPMRFGDDPFEHLPPHISIHDFHFD